MNLIGNLHIVHTINETVNWYVSNNEWSQNIIQSEQYLKWMEKQY